MKLESVRIAEHDFGKRRAATRVVYYLPDYTADVAMAFGEVIGPELCGCFV